MSFVERSYGGKISRPRPEVFCAEDGSLVIIATPWGQRSSAQKAVQIIKDYYASSRTDMESTFPFSRLTCLSPAGNILRAAIYLANDAIYSEDNKEDYNSGVEILVIAKSSEEISWVQIGSPQIFLSQKNLSLRTMSFHFDLASEFSGADGAMPPLPYQLLGLDSSSNFAIHTIRPHKGDKLILVSRSLIEPQFHQLTHNQVELDFITHLFSKNSPNLPFWIGLLDL